jgi:hypothetical protein
MNIVQIIVIIGENVDMVFVFVKADLVEKIAH